MSPRIHWGIEQGTDDWHNARAGMWSSSTAAVIMGGPGTKGLDALVHDIAWGRVYGPPDDKFRSKAMERGEIVEPEARDWYAFEKRVTIQQAGLVEHPTIPHVCWSPDGLILDGDHLVGGIEAKSPLNRAWMDTKRTGMIPSKYRWQCRWGMWVGGLEYLDYVTYHPLAGGLIVRAELTDAERDQMANRVGELEILVTRWTDILLDKQPQLEPA